MPTKGPPQCGDLGVIGMAEGMKVKSQITCEPSFRLSPE
jgi:hypothetical protein